MSRPEHLMPPECFYNDKEARKYTNCTRIITVQSQMTERCLELINIAFNRQQTPAEADEEHPGDSEDLSNGSHSDDNNSEAVEENANEFIEEDEGEPLGALIEPPLCILDIGCGSGLSGELVSAYGHLWWGIDISEDMLLVAQERESEGELMLSDIGREIKALPDVA